MDTTLFQLLKTLFTQSAEIDALKSEIAQLRDEVKRLGKPLDAAPENKE